MIEVSPLLIEQKIREIADRIARSAIVVDQRYRAYLDADRAYDRAYAAAFLAYDGPQGEKRYYAEIETTGLRETRDIAEAAYKYAKDLADALRMELMAYQTVSKSVLATYGVAGRGEM